MYTRASDEERPEKANKCRTGRKQEKLCVHNSALDFKS